MIGVVCGRHEEDIATEFFELFKTPWEFYTPGHAYHVLISTMGPVRKTHAPLTILYGSAAHGRACRRVINASPWGMYVKYKDTTFPIYGRIYTFDPSEHVLARLHKTSAAVVIEQSFSPGKVICAGYDLFQEVDALLSDGQPATNAVIPTLDIHIAMLRSWILSAGISLVEVPPAPDGYDFIACLTHDVDFIRIRDHKFGRTLLGFLRRATLGSLRRWLKGELPWQQCKQNIKAVLSLPGVYAGTRNDFWLEAFERFRELEGDLRSTFFFIPFKDTPGDNVQRRHRKRRAAAYDVTKEQALVQELINAGSEIGVQGIDAWHDVDKGRSELRVISETAGASAPGVRMHWLCFDSRSPQVLEKAGFRYDSTIGYNETVGYRAGTSQVFRPRCATTLLEIPLHIQDMALFDEGYLGLTKDAAWNGCQALLRNAERYGGVVTILWHTRSLAPERQWGDFYASLLDNLKAHRVWFATAGEVAEWFRKRRVFSFKDMNAPDAAHDTTPGLVLRFHAPDGTFTTRRLAWRECA